MTSIKPKITTIKGINVVSAIVLNNRNEIDHKLSTEYSLMKYGDPRSTLSIAVKMVNLLKADRVISREIKNKDLVLTSSSFGYVPTGAYAVTRQMARLLRQEGVRVDILKIDRTGAMGETHYCAMTQEQRDEFMKKRTTWITEQNKKLVKDRFVVIIDDICATGNHLLDINKLISTTEARGRRFATYITFSPDMSSSDASAEGYVSRYFVKSVKDMEYYFNKPANPNLELVINTRTLKFILQTSMSDETDLPEKLKETLVVDFIKTRDNHTLQLLYDAVNSSDGYHEFEKFTKGINIVRSEYNSRKLISLKLNVSKLFVEPMRNWSLFPDNRFTTTYFSR